MCFKLKIPFYQSQAFRSTFQSNADSVSNYLNWFLSKHSKFIKDVNKTKKTLPESGSDILSFAPGQAQSGPSTLFTCLTGFLSELFIAECQKTLFQEPKLINWTIYLVFQSLTLEKIIQIYFNCQFKIPNAKIRCCPFLARTSPYQPVDARPPSHFHSLFTLNKKHKVYFKVNEYPSKLILAKHTESDLSQ